MVFSPCIYLCYLRLQICTLGIICSEQGRPPFGFNGSFLPLTFDELPPGQAWVERVCRGRQASQFRSACLVLQILDNPPTWGIRNIRDGDCGLPKPSLPEPLLCCAHALCTVCPLVRCDWLLARQRACGCCQEDTYRSLPSQSRAPAPMPPELASQRCSTSKPII